MARKIVNSIRRLTTVLLAVCLWLHALFIFDVRLPFIAEYQNFLHLTAAEAVLFFLLLIFSFLAATGFWRMLGSLAYIYFFPFVVMWYMFRAGILVLLLINKWLSAYSPVEIKGMSPKVQLEAAQPTAPPSNLSKVPKKAKTNTRELLDFLTRPVRRFMILWCILLLVATHTSIVWLCLVVVLLQLCRKIFVITKILFFSEPWLTKYAPIMFEGLKKTVATLESVTPGSADHKQLKSLLDQVDFWRKILNFLEHPYLMSRWAWILATAFFVVIYTYFSLLFSFAYYGIGRLSQISYSWPDAFITSLFIPAYVGDLPKVLAIRVLGGFHFTLVVLIGIGTVLNFMQRKLEAVRKAATAMSERLSSESIQSKYLLLVDTGSSATDRAAPSPPIIRPADGPVDSANIVSSQDGAEGVHPPDSTGA